MTRLAALDRRLQELHPRTAETPLFNPVFQLGLELSRELESGQLSLGELAELVAELECQGLQSRAERLAQDEDWGALRGSVGELRHALDRVKGAITVAT